MSNSKTTERFDRAAATWDESQIRTKMVKAVVEKIKEKLPLSKGMKALEFGCGTGLVTVLMAPMLGNFTAIDSSESMLEQLQLKIKDMNLSSVTCKKVDINTEDIPGNNYDFIFSNMTIHHIKDISILFKKMYDTLADGGILAVTDLDSEDGSFHSDMTGVQHHGFRRGDVVSAFERAGFTRCTVEDAHVVEKIVQDNMKQYPMFIATGRKQI